LKNHFFILGCERSGSTWVSNVMSTHPGVDGFMEPFADYANIFPGFPSRNLCVDEPSRALEQLVRDGFEKLPALKYAYLYRPGRNPSFRRADAARAAALRIACRALRMQSPPKCTQFELLNLGQTEIPARFLVRGSHEKTCMVVKELRLNFKVALLKETFPESRCLIVMRHPCTQVASILRLYREGKLAELRRATLTFSEHVLESRLLGKYRHLVRDWDDKSLEHRLLVWWIINYGVLLEDCRRLEVGYQILKHEDLCEHPPQSFREAFDFFELDFPQSVQDYVDYTSKAIGHRALSPVDTRRNSSSHARLAFSEVSAESLQLMTELLASVEVPAELTSYRQAPCLAPGEPT
jgi:hypothetical protein